MSFLSVIQDIFGIFSKVSAVVTPLEPVIATIPGGTTFNTIFNYVVQVEQLFAGTVSQGPAKKAVVTALVNAQAGISITPTLLSSTIDEVITNMNALQTTKTKVGG